MIKETLCKLVKFHHLVAKFCSPENLCVCQLNFLFPFRNFGYACRNFTFPQKLCKLKQKLFFPFACKIFTFHWKPLHLFTKFFQLLTDFSNVPETFAFTCHIVSFSLLTKCLVRFSPRNFGFYAKYSHTLEKPCKHRFFMFLKFC